MTAQYLGYRTSSRPQRVLAGQTMSVDFELESEVVGAEGIVATIEREPLIVRDNTISKTRFTVEEIRGLPVDDLESVIELGAGVYETALGCGPVSFEDALRDSCGFIVRGGRATESATFVDGVLITDLNSRQRERQGARHLAEQALLGLLVDEVGVVAAVGSVGRRRHRVIGRSALEG
ncbi:MAG TPA: hypothetical protein VEY33_09875 [Gemmatimonadota bacterium]|nr:hypothetical protein [Gemmatimonadota bacterium]